MGKKETAGSTERLPPEAAFVVQLRADAGAEHGRFAGRVEHVVTGRAARFASLRELRAFIVRALGGSAESLRTDGEEREGE